MSLIAAKDGVSTGADPGGIYTRWPWEASQAPPMPGTPVLGKFSGLLIQTVPARLIHTTLEEQCILGATSVRNRPLFLV